MARPGAGTPPAEVRSLRVVLAASTLSKVADWQLGIVLPLAVLAQTGSVAATLASVALRALPYAASPVLGSLIDRFDRRAVFVGAQLSQAASMAGIALLLTDRIAVGVLLLLSGFGAVVTTITGQFVLIPKLVEPDRRAAAVARLAAAIELSKVVGLVLGGAVVATRGPRVATWGVAALYVAAGLVSLRLPRLPSAGARPALRRDLAVGFRWLARPDIAWLVVTMAMANLAVGALETVLVTVLGDRRVEPLAISATLAVGLLLGAVGSRVSPHLAPGWPAERRILLFQVMALVGLAVVAIPHVAGTVLGFAGVAFALGGSNVASITYRQRAIPVDLAGRVNAVIRMFITGAVPLSGFLYAAAARLPEPVFWVPALAAAAAAVAVWAAYAVRVERVADPQHDTDPRREQDPR